MSYLHRLVPDEVGGDIIYLDNGTTTIGNKQVKSKKVGASVIEVTADPDSTTLTVKNVSDKDVIVEDRPAILVMEKWSNPEPLAPGETTEVPPGFCIWLAEGEAPLVHRTVSSQGTPGSNKAVHVETSEWGWGRPADSIDDFDAWWHFPYRYLFGLVFLIPALMTYFSISSFWWLVFPTLVILFLLPIFSSFILLYSRMYGSNGSGPSKLADYFDIKDASFGSKWATSKVPIETLHEAYFDDKLDIKEGTDLLESMYRRHSYSTFQFTWAQVKFFVLQFIPEVLVHSREQDVDQVRDHYERGNDFYMAFLGDPMIYTSGFFKSVEDTLEVAQEQKMDMVCQKLQFQPGDKHLDIGCGWGTLVAHAARKYGTTSTGVTLSRDQVEFGNERIRQQGVSDRAELIVSDYRDIPKNKKWDKITCLEMAEHVGVRKFQSFMRQIYGMLEDDGMFYLQIAGLRRSWQFEDFQWGLFMAKYIFPGADASCPLGWVVNQLEQAGFECHSIENIGVHYSATLKRWYDNFKTNEEYIIKQYGLRWFRIWMWFLAWATIASEQGSATCYMMVCRKNTNAWDRKRMIGEHALCDVGATLQPVL